LQLSRNEKSAGFVIFRRNGGRKFLFLTNKGRYDVPKGLKQEGEDDLECALRELKEETGIGDVSIIPNFKRATHYFYRWENTLISKDVVYFLGEANSGEVQISSEHDGYSWLTKDEVLSKIKYKNLRGIIMEVDQMISTMKK
jgi:8-oxo-dGTP pyrophosphatase MutT (NUDIX family)